MINNNDISQLFKESSATSFLVLLISVDLVFIALHILWVGTPLISNDLFSIGKDHGYPEIFQYIKEFWIVILLLSFYVKTREFGYIAWTMLFTYMLCDDTMRIHENVGQIIANNLDFTPLFGLGLKDFGELVTTAISAAFLLTIISFFYVYGSSMFRKISRDLLALVLLVVFFGVFIDMINSAVKVGWNVNHLLGILEDGGEMIAISLTTWYVFLLNVRDSQKNG